MARSRLDDEYDDSPRPRPAANGGGNAAVKIIAIIAGVVVILFLGCGGLIFLGCYSMKRSVDKMQQQMFSQMDKMQEEQKLRQAGAQNSDKTLSKQAAEKFLAEVKARRYDAAYQLTSVAYRKDNTKKEFQDYVTKHFEALTGTGGSPLREDFSAPDQGTTYTVTRKAFVSGSFVDVTLTMIKENGGWKVDQLRVGKD